MVNLGPCLTLGSACNSLIKSLVSWASYCVAFGPQVENNWPTRARMEKLNKKIQPVWLEVEYKVEPVWLLPTSMNSFDLNSFENSFGLPRVTALSFLRSCRSLKGSFPSFYTSGIVLWFSCSFISCIRISLATYVEAPQVQRWCRCSAMASEGKPSIFASIPCQDGAVTNALHPLDCWWFNRFASACSHRSALV